MLHKPKGRSLPKMLRDGTVAAMLAMPVLAGAQGFVPSSIPDTLIYSVGYSTLRNNAIYDYVPGSKQLKVTTFDNTAGAIIHFDDGVTSLDQTLPIPPGGISVAYFPDIAIGDGTSATSAYVAAVYNIETSTAPSWSRIYLQGYSVTGLGTGSMAITAVGAPVAVSNANTLAGPSHIDIAADYTNPMSPVGAARCSQFIVSWGDWDAGTNSGIWAVNGTLPNTIGTSAHVYTPSPLPTIETRYYPDVSAVLRTGDVNPRAEIVFGIQDGVYPLDYLDYNFNGGIASGFITIVANNAYWQPRITGIDDYHSNNPNTGNVYEYIADYGLNSHIFNTYYRSNTGAFSSASFLSASGDSSFALATGPDAKTYSVIFGKGLEAFLVKPLWSTGLPSGWPSSYSLYQVNNNGIPQSHEALDASCNDNCSTILTPAVLATWNSNPTGGTFEKSIISPVAHFRTTSVTNVSGEELFTASPNPASDHLILGVPSNYNNDCMYGLMDMAGRVVVQQPITQPNQQINIAELPKGMYLLNIYNGSSLQQSMKIVKR